MSRQPRALFLELGRNFLDPVVGAETILVPDERAVLDQVDYAGELFLGADRKLEHQRLGLELVADLPDHALEVGAHAVHLVDERDARNAILVGLAPHGLGLRLDAADRAEHRHRAVEHAEAALDLDREIDVSGRVDDIDPMVAPETGGRRRRDRDAALLLLHHPVHRGRAFVHFTDLVIDAGVVEHPLGRGGLAGVDVRHDADIAHIFYGSFTRHLATYFRYFRFVRFPINPPFR